MAEKKTRVYANLTVGRARVGMSWPSHVKGIREGNKTGSIEREPGLVPEEDRRFAKGTARRSTGINAHARNPIDPRMPNLSPS